MRPTSDVRSINSHCPQSTHPQLACLFNPAFSLLFTIYNAHLNSIQFTRKRPAEDSPHSPCIRKRTRGPVEGDVTGSSMDEEDSYVHAVRDASPESGFTKLEIELQTTIEGLQALLEELHDNMDHAEAVRKREMREHELQIKEHTDRVADLESKVRSQQDLLRRQSMDLECLQAKTESQEKRIGELLAAELIKEMLNEQHTRGPVEEGVTGPFMDAEYSHIHAVRDESPESGVTALEIELQTTIEGLQAQLNELHDNMRHAEAYHNWEMHTHKLEVKEHTDRIADLESKVRSQQDLLDFRCKDLERLEATRESQEKRIRDLVRAELLKKMLNEKCLNMMRDAIQILDT
ncbi:uncharacterized protein EDB91DRAFT_1256732 [Suillus paluster]|uniref:uncharacterized protein n=1 Tax=Suillus paluster TaxID=48578 RepID=UPI001B86E914|nr:uncharacterized protein EDB91DRAFT_1256732 [Suillus paluster]KAG1720976.1 hypothetical protein EDB91DRAFT_1256732 [Suillus paluster]